MFSLHTCTNKDIDENMNIHVALEMFNSVPGRFLGNFLSWLQSHPLVLSENYPKRSAGARALWLGKGMWEQY